MKTSMKILSVLMVLVVAIMAAANVSALVQSTNLPVNVEWVKLNGDELSNDNTIDNFDRNDEYTVKVRLVANQDVKDIEVSAMIDGYDQNDKVRVYSDRVFDLKAGEGITVSLPAMTLPFRMDKDYYDLKVRVASKIGDFETSYRLNVRATEHSMKIRDIAMNPSSAVQAGRSLLSTVRLENIGNKDDNAGVQVKMEVPELGLSAIDYIDELESDDSTTSEELWVVVPKCAQAGTYDVVFTVTYHDGDEKVTETRSVNVLASDACPIGKDSSKSKTLIAVNAAPQDYKEGGVIFPVSLVNEGSAAKTYVLSVDGYQDWATVSVAPSAVVVVQPGEAKAVSVHVSALEAAAVGEHSFTLSVSSGDEQLYSTALKVNVKEEAASSSWGGVKRGLEVGLIVLIILLVILGLIIGFNKLRGNDEEESDEESKTYY